MDEKQREFFRLLRDDFTVYAPTCLKIRSESGAKEPLILNKAQKYAHQLLEDQRKRTGKVRAIVLKGRQMGMSTLIEGRYYWRVTHNTGMRAFILTHEDNATANLFEMAKRYHENCPEILRPKIKASNAIELVFDELDSGYRLGTAGNKSVGRSSTIQFLHACLAEGTLVVDPVTSKLRPIESYNVNDLVRTHNNNHAPISYISSQKKNCYEILLRGLSKFPIVATGKHVFFTQRGWVSLEQIDTSDYIGHPVYPIESTILSIPFKTEKFIHPRLGGKREDVPENVILDFNVGRIVGLYLAEGTIKFQAKYSKKPCAVTFSVHEDEVDRTCDWLSKISHLFKSIKVQRRKTSKSCNVIAYGKSFSVFMLDLVKKCDEKQLPEKWWLMGEKFCDGMVLGYLAGDGHFKPRRDRVIHATSIRSSITVGMRDAIASLGYGWASISYKKAGIRHGRNEKEAFILSLCGPGVEIISKKLGKPFVPRQRGERGNAVTTKIKDGYAWIKVKQKRECGLKKVFDFEVDHPDHSYCILQGATHNSEVAFYKHADEHAKGIMQAVPNVNNTEIIIESTANGVGDWFHQMWQAAEAGISDYIAIFTPWFWKDEYRRELREGFQRTAQEDELQELYGLDDNQLMWRRMKIVDLSVNGADGEKFFMQEYPNNATEAFQMSGEDSFIKSDIVMKARNQNKYNSLERVGPLLIGVDPARFGDDRTAIIRRQGRVAFGLESYIKKDTMEIAGRVHSIILSENPTKVFIDVVGLGAGVYDRLKELGHGDKIVAVNSANSALDDAHYANKRAEMWGLGKQWLLDEPVQMPDTNSLHADLCSAKYKADSKGRILIESKADMKKRGVRSPDEADALLLTFALPVAALDTNKKAAAQIAKSIMSPMRKVQQIRKTQHRAI